MRTTGKTAAPTMGAHVRITAKLRGRAFTTTGIVVDIPRKGYVVVMDDLVPGNFWTTTSRECEVTQEVN